MSKRLFQLLSLMFGLIGLMGCAVALVTTWSVNVRVSQASEKLFGNLDNSLVAVHQRVAETEDRVQALRITAEDIEASAQNWVKAEARERAGSQLRLEEKAEHLTSGLDQAGHWLELTHSSAQLVQRSLEVGKLLGVPVQTDAADRLLKEIVSLQAQFTQATESVNSIRERATNVGQEDPPEDRILQVAKLTARVMVTLSSVDSRFEALGDRLTEIQTKARDAEAKASWWIGTLAMSITLLIAWMMAGQGALCYLGWRGFRQRHSLLNGE